MELPEDSNLRNNQAGLPVVFLLQFNRFNLSVSFSLLHPTGCCFRLSFPVCQAYLGILFSPYPLGITLPVSVLSCFSFRSLLGLLKQVCRPVYFPDTPFSQAYSDILLIYCHYIRRCFVLGGARLLFHEVVVSAVSYI